MKYRFNCQEDLYLNPLEHLAIIQVIKAFLIYLEDYSFFYSLEYTVSSFSLLKIWVYSKASLLISQNPESTINLQYRDFYF